LISVYYSAVQSVFVIVKCKILLSFLLTASHWFSIATSLAQYYYITCYITPSLTHPLTKSSTTATTTTTTTTTTGFFLGDGAGVGKGRQLAGMILENWSMGRRRHVWLSVSSDLYLDALRDLRDIGAGHIKAVALHKLPYKPIDLKEGIVFVTYSSLIASSGGLVGKRVNGLVGW
jgi:hypothetical protein